MEKGEKSNDKEINLTYETLFELVRREKNRADLQKLEQSFFADFINYLHQKKSVLENRNKGDFFSQGEKQKAEQQVYNIKKLIKELYDRREKKIIDMAIVKARTNSEIIDGNLSDTDKLLFEDLNDILTKYRRAILIPLMDGQSPETKDLKTESFDTNLGESGQNDSFSQKYGKKGHENSKKIEILEFIPEFVGSDLEEYGPFEEKDVLDLPEHIASLLVQNKVAKFV